MKVVINKCFGGYSLSPTALLWLYEHGAADKIATPVDEYWTKPNDGGFMSKSKALLDWREYLSTKPIHPSAFLTPFSSDEMYVLHTHPDDDKLPRHDPLLVQCISELGSAANGSCAELAVVEIPDGTDYIVEEYDGMEHIAEVHRTWS